MLNPQRLKQRRNDLKLTLEDVGNIAGIHKSAVQKYEKGIIKNVQVSTVELFAKALECNPAYLLNWVDVPDVTETPADAQVFSTIELDIINKFRSMNLEGQEKAVDYLDDLIASGKYKKDNQHRMGAQTAG